MTQGEFENTVWQAYPHKHMFLQVDPFDPSGAYTLFALDTAAECNLPVQDKMKIADYVWKEGKLIKDRNNLFAQGIVKNRTTFFANGGAGGNNSFVLPPGLTINHIGHDWAFDTINIKSPICECGKDKHGFASHSNWCEKFEPVVI